MKVAVIGAGSWGTAIADLLAGKGLEVALWSRRLEVVEGISQEHRNPVYLSQSPLSPALSATSDIGEAVAGADIIAMAVPSHAMRETASLVSDRIDAKDGPPAVVSLAKGIEAGTLKRMSQVLMECCTFAGHGVAALSGPNHAEEVICGIPTATVISCADESLGAKLQEVFMTSSFRVYTNDDLIGVELGGATKNVIALAVGVSDGLGFGDNTKASLMTRGLAEMARLGTALGANSRTFSGLSGLGDLIATCTSRHSRNRAVGERMGKGESVADITADMRMVAEGVNTAPAVVELSRAHGVDLPVAVVVSELLGGEKSAAQCVADLMSRGAAHEFEGW